MQRELEKVAGKLVLLEYTTLESLRNENGVGTLCGVQRSVRIDSLMTIGA